MLILSKTATVPTAEQTIGLLAKHQSRLGGVPMDYDRICEYYSINMFKSDNLLRRICRYINGKDMCIDASGFKYWLLKSGVEAGLLKTEKNDYSMGGESLASAVATGLYSKELCSLMTMYGEASSLSAKVSVFKALMEDYPIVRYPTFDNHRMIIVSPIYTVQLTGRLGMSKPALQNMAHELSDIRTVPKGWISVYTDSGQIEPRIIQSHFIGDKQIKALINLYNDAYYAYVHYCTKLTQADINSGTTDFTKFEITDEMVEFRKRFKTYGNAVMYGSRENNLNDPYKKAFIQRIGDHTKRKEWFADVSERVASGQTIFHTVFGTPVDITKSKGNAKYYGNPDGLFHHKVQTALNSQVQGTAADLGRYSLGKADFLLARKAPNSFILEWVHDSERFAVHENEYDTVIDDLKGIAAYQVDDWVPVYSDLVIGIPNSSGIPRLV